MRAPCFPPTLTTFAPFDFTTRSADATVDVGGPPETHPRS